MTSVIEATVRVFRDGYASDNKGSFKIAATATNDEIDAQARKLFGGFATVYEIARPIYGPSEQFSAEYVRQMSMGG